MGGGPPPGPGGPPMGGPPMGGPPMGGADPDVTVEDLLEALKQLPEEMLRQLVAELMKFLGPGGAEAGPPPGPGGPPMGGGAPGGLADAAKARAGL
tara:strand:+ start:3965 stop:4252 length:288 start_codon:yes stop_codon:yes gene_type:complete